MRLQLRGYVILIASLVTAACTTPAAGTKPDETAAAPNAEVSTRAVLPAGVSAARSTLAAPIMRPPLLPPPPPPPSNCSNLCVTVLGLASARVDWAPYQGAPGTLPATHYQVWRSQAGLADASVADVPVGGTLSITDAQLQHATTYTYYVKVLAAPMTINAIPGAAPVGANPGTIVNQNPLVATSPLHNRPTDTELRICHAKKVSRRP